MKPMGIVALLLGIALAGLIALTTRKSGFDVTRWPDGEFTIKPWTFNANIDVDPDLRSLLREFRPGDRGDWIHYNHAWFPLSHDRVTLERGGGTLDYSRGRARYWLGLSCVAAGPGLAWLLARGMASLLSRKIPS